MKGDTFYFYRVSESMKNLKTDQSFSHSEDFRAQSWIEAREEAFEYYNNRLEGMIGKYNDFEVDHTIIFGLLSPGPIGKTPVDHSFKFTVCLVAQSLDGKEIEYPLEGEDPSICQESLVFESMVYLEAGLMPPPYLSNK